MATATGSSTLHFPEQDAIVAYLTEHPLTRDRDLAEKQIIKTVAEFFANKDKLPIGVDTGVMLTMYDLNKKLKLPETGVMFIQMNLTAALKDCAAGKAITVEKKTKD